MLTPFQGFLAALADSDFSAPFYLIAMYQLVILVLNFKASIRNSISYRIALVMALAALSAVLALGVFFAMRPPA